MSPPLPAERNSTEPVPLRPKSIGVLGRLMFVAAALGMTAMMGVARLVEPDLRGYGTHEQLGLPPCTFRLLTGFACPSCGMTTSFAYVVRGEVARAARTNPGGCLLALGTLPLVPWCLASALAGRSLGIRAPERVALVAAMVVFAASLANWVVRFLFLGGQG